MIEAPSGEPPVVDRLDTRHLEARAVERGFVRSVSVTSVGERSIHFTTDDRVVPGPGHRARPGAPGTLRIDVCGDDAVRIRYAPGEGLPDRPSPMVVGDLGLPSSCEIAHDDDSANVSTPAMTVEVRYKPFSVRIVSADGRWSAEVGGREKNAWSLWDTYNTGVSRSPEHGRPLATECFALRPNEAVYGFGEQFIGLDKVGQTIDVNMVEATGTTTPRSYKNIPFFVTTGGYGVYFNTSARMTAWIGSRGAADVGMGIEDDHLDFTVFVGDIPTILDRYTTLTGKPSPPPRWSFGLWQSKISYSSADECREVVRGMRDGRFPMDVLHVDTHWFREDWYCDLTFDAERFPDPAGWLAELRDAGVHVSLWQLPYIPEGNALFDELAEAGGFVRDTDGGIYDVGISYTPGYQGLVGIIDFTNPVGVAVYQRWLRKLFDLGAAAIKVDFGEQAPLDGVYHDGTPGHLMHNRYPLLYNQAVAEVTADATGDHIIWARSTWAGSQRYPLHWGGDSSANWHNLVPQFAGGLSMGLSGFSYWSQDTGGFLGQPDGPLLTRWLQVGILLSHVRIHGFGTRELFRFDEETQRIGRETLELRMRLLPYLWSVSESSAAAGVPMARPLVLDHQDDPSTYRIADQWLLGPDLLVAPICDETDRRKVYLPAGTWFDWATGERTEGRRWIDVEAPLDRIPMWLRAGGVVPLGPVQQHVDAVQIDELEVVVAPFPSDGETTRRVPLEDDRRVTLRYRASGGSHSLAHVDGPAVALHPRSLDGTRVLGSR